jgi:hypothetical protein
MDMTARTFAALVFGAASLIAASNANAQQPNQLDQCRDAAVRRGLSGDGLSQFLSQCMAQPAPTGRQATFASCRSNMVSRGLTGDALYDAIGDCMQGSGSSDAGLTGTYQQCRSQARAQGLSGMQIDQYLNDCITH